MHATMTHPEIQLARRIVGLRGTAFRARGNGLRIRRAADRPALTTLAEKGHAAPTADGSWKLTAQGIQQLKLQIGEFSFR